MYSYKKEFNKAFESTVRLGFPVVKNICDNQIIFTDANIKCLKDLFNKVIELAIEDNQIEKQLINLQTNNQEIYNRLARTKLDENYYYLVLFRNCLNINVTTLNLINECSNINAYLTLGYYRDELLEKNFHEFSASDFQKILHDKNLDIHAWITLDTLEIIDFTLLTSIGFLKGEADLIGTIYHHYPDVSAQTNRFTHYPVIIATDEVLKAFNSSD